MSEAETTDRLERWRAVRQRMRDEGLSQPWFDVRKSYDFPLFPPEQLRWLPTLEARWARPAISLEAFCAAKSSEGPAPSGGSAFRSSRSFEFEPANTWRCA